MDTMINLKNIEAVIFDWAGTTIDFGCFAPVRAFVEAFEGFDIEPTIEEVRKPMGMLKVDHIRTMLSMPRIKGLWIEKYGKEPVEEDVNKVYELYEKILFKALYNYTTLKPGTKEVVSHLRNKEIKIGSTTGYTKEMMSIVTKGASLNGYSPDCLVCPDDVNNYGRPYPYMIFENMKILGVQSVDKVLKVGDTISDIKEGKNAGVITAAVVVGSSEMGLAEEEYNELSTEAKTEKCIKVKKKFLEAGADIVFETLEDLISYL